MRYLEWNIHGAGGYGDYAIPEFVADTILQPKYNVDIIILVEFYMGHNWNRFRNRLEEDYDIFISPFIDYHNQVLIAIKKNVLKVIDVITVNPLDKDIPELFAVDTSIGDRRLIIAGNRIKSQAHNKEPQYDYLKNFMNRYETIICAGDDNCTCSYLKNKFRDEIQVFGPRIMNKKWSYVHENGDRVGVDWLLAKGIKEFKNFGEDADQSPYATYDWDFVNEMNGYGTRKNIDYLSDLPLPDHGILNGEFNI